MIKVSDTMDAIVCSVKVQAKLFYALLNIKYDYLTLKTAIYTFIKKNISTKFIVYLLRITHCLNMK